MRIAVDAMGGDFAPVEIVKGAAEGSKLHDVDVILVGDTDRINRCLPKNFVGSGRITIQHATEVIGMDEHVDAVRTKRDASVVVAASLVKSGMAEAMVSVGNTAAAMAVATLNLGRIREIDRPAIATLFPSKSGVTIMLDSGAVVDCTVDNLVQFALMGSIYAEKVLSIHSPRVGLLSVGEEKSKGSELIKSAHIALLNSPLNFTGNVEGRDLFSGTVDVLVTDGFAGNVALKTAEGVAEYAVHMVKQELRSPMTWLPIFMLAPSLKRLKKKLDYSEYGGAPLLGLDGICIIGHGRSNARAVSNAIRAAKEAVQGRVVEAISESVAIIKEHPPLITVEDTA